MLAAAGLRRLDLSHRIAQVPDPALCLPAVGQGVVGIECREDDWRIRALLAPLNDAPAQLAVRAERAVNRILDGGCHAPLACHAELQGGALRLRALVGTLDGARLLRSDHTGPAGAPEALGETVAGELIDKGALEIIAPFGHTQGARRGRSRKAGEHGR